MIDWKDETALWEYQAPRLRGWWRRLEATVPDGLPDSFGLYMRSTHWLERKIGKPSKDALRPKQIEFALVCLERGVSWHVCFGYQGEVLFFKDLSLTQPIRPSFWIAERSGPTPTSGS